MPSGRPHFTKCPSCKRGEGGKEPTEKGVAVIGHEVCVFVNARHSWSGHRGIVECMDCGYVWSSSLQGVSKWVADQIRAGIEEAS